MKSVFAKEESYWSERLDAEDRMSVLPYCKASMTDSSQSGGKSELQWKLPLEVSNRIFSMANGMDMAVYILLLTGVHCLFYKYTQQEHALLGMPASTELDDGREALLDLLVIKNKLSRHSTFKSLVGAVKTSVLEAIEHRRLPFGQMVERMGMEYDPNGLPVVNTIVSYKNIHALHAEESALTDTVFRFASENNEIQLCVRFDDHKYDHEYISKMIDHYVRLLSVVLNQPDLEIGEADMLSASEKHQLLVEWNDRRPNLQEEARVIHRCFEQQAERVPHQLAVQCGSHSLTYKELNEQANRMAHELKRRGVTRDVIVGVMTERTVSMMIGLLAVLKAGGAYLPIDPALPRERIEYMLDDSGARLLLTTAGHMTDWMFAGAILDVDDVSSYAEDTANLACPEAPEDLMYVIYTSGSTGKPKGVMIPHRAFHQFAYSLSMHFAQPFDERDRCLSVTSISFDVSVAELFTPLLFGASLVLFPHPDGLDPRLLADVILEDAITFAYIPPTLLNEVAQFLEHNKDGLRLDKMLVGVEPITNGTLERFVDLNPAIVIVNGYGPTEATICSNMYTYKPGSPSGSFVPIGKPMHHTEVYILGSDDQPVPAGVAGELCIAGRGLARGYVNQPELTRSKFAAHPFDDSRIMYRTGDLAKWLPDGNVMYLGRMDQQVKVRGYRIELGEIQSRLAGIAAVREAVVIAREDQSGQKQLCAYYSADHELSVSGLRSTLLKELPGYMIPSYFVQLERLPLTPNGKVDRKALPAPEGSMRTSAEYAAPSTPLEAQLVRIWEEVLGLARVGVKDHFFEIGGHSLRATTLISRLHKELHVNVPLREVFRFPTVEQLAEVIAGMEQERFSAIAPIAEQEHYLVSSAQKRLYILHQLEGAELSYNMPAVLQLEGELDRERFEGAFGKLIRRHEVLRTGFPMVDGEPVQRVHREVDFAVEYLQADVAEAEDAVRRFVRAFDLEKPPLLRVGLIELAPERHLFLFDMHHIISDGVSMGILVDEFARLYGGEELSPLRIQYKDYAAWQQSGAQSEQRRRQEAYWLKEMSGELPVLDMPTDYARPAVRSFQGKALPFTIDGVRSERLRQLASETGTTLHMVLLALYTALLHKYTGQEDIIVGTPVAGRTHADLQPLIGMFVGTLAIRSYPAGAKTFEAYLEEIKETMLGAYEHQEYPFEELVEQVQAARDMSRNAVFDTMFIVQNAEQAELNVDGLQLKPYPHEQATAKFDLTFQAAEQEGGIACSLRYASDLYKPATVERLAKHFERLIDAVIGDRGAPIASLEIVTAEEKEQLLYGFHAVQAEYPREKTLHRLFEEQAERSPEAAAVVYEDRQLTYRELNERANRVARTLRKAGVQADCRVGLLMERSLEMVIGMMAILKAGGAYVPLDPEYPEERLLYMLADSGAEWVLTTKEHDLPAGAAGVQRIVLTPELLGEGDGSNADSTTGSHHLAYVIYTSGTTGQPKGVLIEHRNVGNLVAGLAERIYSRHDGPQRIAWLSPHVFDASVKQLFASLLLGHTLYVVPREISMSGERLAAYYNAHRIQVSDGTPAHLRILLESAHRFGAINVERFIIGGEALHGELVNALRGSWTGGCRPAITNIYGPTECCVDTTAYTVGAEEDAGTAIIIPIGKPLANQAVYILDREQRLVPIGVGGELYIGGENVGRGYLNRPELTCEKFVPNPYKPGERMYRTGDLARWQPDGNIEYLGRIDQQVKIRGYRIELGEVQARLEQVPAVREAAVIARADRGGETTLSLCAYFVADTALTTRALREALSHTLPAHMIPTFFVQLEKMPLTSNGKLDRRALPDPDSSMRAETEYEAPRTSMEAQLVRIWQEVLGLARVGVKDNFFEIGGHSLSLMRLVHTMYRELHIEISLQKVFQHPTVEAMAYAIWEKDLSGKKDNPFIKLNENGHFNVFCFPSVFGYGLTYMGLAQELESYCILYAADFIGDSGSEDSDALIDGYVDAIIQIQGQSPYVLLGYSLGGNLMFEVAKAMERRGCHVSDIIIVDSIRRQTLTPLYASESEAAPILLEAAEGPEKELLHNDYIREHVENIMRSYRTYVSTIMNTGTVQANIHALSAEKSDGSGTHNDQVLTWNESTEQNFWTYPLTGDHYSVFSRKHAGENAGVLKMIVHQIVDQTYKAPQMML
ncbi:MULTISPECIES: non-ribosomal peptide synthetase [Paenibacillus]|uniref:non-ribosomal peptide synthetase n=1 Tax=Paenibacillus TaxID=44249 RepID=UPI0022B8992B|nr:non-ribosomal peptide synthetase [Paenibacillus caseinilyticus]MCZ8518252.1 amino acid adenylation domain-containing protein [Paenibacillus caseinilyticus]